MKFKCRTSWLLNWETRSMVHRKCYRADVLLFNAKYCVVRTLFHYNFRENFQLKLKFIFDWLRKSQKYLFFEYLKLKCRDIFQKITLLKTVAFIAGKNNPAIQKKIIHFSIEKFIANICLYALSWPKLNFGCYLTFEIIF